MKNIKRMEFNQKILDKAFQAALCMAPAIYDPNGKIDEGFLKIVMDFYKFLHDLPHKFQEALHAENN